MQFQADILGVPVVRPAVTETTALGAAFLAGIGVGFWREPQLADLARDERRFEPGMPQSKATDLRQRWNDAVSRTKDWERGASRDKK
jgi:glycerol kinase